MNNANTFSDRVGSYAVRLTESSPAAIAGLYDLTAERLVRYAVTITRHHDDAEDAVQTTLVKIAGQPRLLRASKQPWAYLLRMVRNEALGILRWRRRWRVVQNLTDLVTRRANDQLEGEDQREAVWRALRELPTTQGEVVVLKIWEEMTFQQIAEVLDISPSTAASRYRYAIEKLGKKLRHCATEEVFHV